MLHVSEESRVRVSYGISTNRRSLMRRRVAQQLMTYREWP